MKYVTSQSWGPAARKVKPISRAKLRNPGLRTFHGPQMGDWWDDLTSTISDTADDLWDNALSAGQKAATNLVQKELVKIIGADGKVKEVAANSPEAVAYQNTITAQQQAQLNASASQDKMMTYMMYGMAGIGGLIAIALVVKLIKK